MARMTRVGMIVLLSGVAMGSGCRGDKSRRPPLTTPVLTAAEEGDRHYLRGEYAEAAAAYERALLVADDPQEAQDLLFQLALCYLSSDPGPAGQSRALVRLRRHRPAEGSRADLLLDLLESLEELRTDLGVSQREIRRLSRELEKLREIDLNRRPPGGNR